MLEKPRKKVSAEVQTASAFVPAHISGFFQPCVEAEEPELRGSRNCGPCLTAGVLTKVEVERASHTTLSTWLNGERARVETSSAVAKRILSIAGEPLKTRIHHFTQVPLGAGYGASGACALGSALALSKALGLSLARERLVAIAHIVEVECRTGLGDVGPQTLGGLVIGLEPGPPPHGKMRKIPISSDIKIVCATLGPLRTKRLLGDEEFLERSERLGGLALKKLVNEPTPENFMKLSREFAEGLGLLDDELRELIGAALRAGAIGASQIMLGRAVFALVKEGKLKAVKRAFSELLGLEAVVEADVDRKGAVLLG